MTMNVAEGNPNPNPNILLLPRREPFEHAIIPIPKLLFSDGALTLCPLRDQLLLRRNPDTGLVSAQTLAEALQIHADHAALVIEVLASVLPPDREIAEKEADVFDLVLFLYLQSYKRLVPRPHKDSAAVADVWPSTSAFDGYLSAISPIQLVRSNSRRFLPSQADQEAHQLSYLQKHMPNLLTLLSESVEGEGDESLVLTLERFQHLGLLIQFVQNECEGIPLSQAAPFFANSDSDIPATPVLAAQVLDWILQSITASLEHTLEKTPSKENSSMNAAVYSWTFTSDAAEALRLLMERQAHEKKAKKAKSRMATIIPLTPATDAPSIPIINVPSTPNTNAPSASEGASKVSKVGEKRKTLKGPTSAGVQASAKPPTQQSVPGSQRSIGGIETRPNVRILTCPVPPM